MPLEKNLLTSVLLYIWSVNLMRSSQVKESINTYSVMAKSQTQLSYHYKRAANWYSPFNRYEPLINNNDEDLLKYTPIELGCIQVLLNHYIIKFMRIRIYRYVLFIFIAHFKSRWCPIFSIFSILPFWMQFFIVLSPHKLLIYIYFQQMPAS